MFKKIDFALRWKTKRRSKTKDGMDLRQATMIKKKANTIEKYFFQNRGILKL